MIKASFLPLELKFKFFVANYYILSIRHIHNLPKSNANYL